MTLKTEIQITEIIMPKSVIVKDLDINCGDILEIKLSLSDNYFRSGHALYINITNLTSKKTIRNFSFNTFARNNYFNYIEL
jgi:hypothetical protein